MLGLKTRADNAGAEGIRELPLYLTCPEWLAAHAG